MPTSGDRQAEYVALLDNRLSTLHEDVGEIKTVLKDLTSAITRLALVEERMTNASAAQERAFKAIEAQDKRLQELEKKVPELHRTASWIDKGIWAAVAALATYVLKKVGIL